MKRLVIILFFLILLSISFIQADVFSIVWGTKQGEVTIGGSGISSPLGQQGVPPSGITPTPAPAPSATPSAGGITTTISGFGVNNTFMLIRVKKGEPVQQQIIITNKGNTSLPIDVSIINLTGFIFPTEKSFALKPGESKTVFFNIYVSELEKENIFTGKINFKSPTALISVDIVLEASEKTALFDIKATLLKKTFFQGQKATANVKVLNLGDLKNIDVELESKIIDSRNNVYDSAKETFAINNSAVKTVSLKIPADISLGKYYFFSKVSYRNVSAASYDAFDILKTLVHFGELVFYFIIVTMVVLITLISIIFVNKAKER